MRVERAYKVNSWSENPSARTRRIIGNVELLAQEDDQLTVVSNFHMYYVRPGSEGFLYSGQRRDVFVQQAAREGGAYLIQRREIIMDCAEIDQPTLGLLF